EDKIKEDHFFLTWGDILVPYKIYTEVMDTYHREKQDFILVTNYLEKLQKGCEIHCEGDYCTKMVEKPPKDKQASNLNNCGIFIFSKEIFKELKELEPSKRGELEIPDAISNGIEERNWKVRVIRMGKEDFRGDFGDKREYERLDKETDWLSELQ
ncbi:MAG: hypothetical protein EU548_02470, partial [Promethearchaeota archaeon]